jgi:hypothetical protein
MLGFVVSMCPIPIWYLPLSILPKDITQCTGTDQNITVAEKLATENCIASSISKSSSSVSVYMIESTAGAYISYEYSKKCYGAYRCLLQKKEVCPKDGIVWLECKIEEGECFSAGIKNWKEAEPGWAVITALPQCSYIEIGGTNTRKIPCKDRPIMFEVKKGDRVFMFHFPNGKMIEKQAATGEMKIAMDN